MQQYLVKDVAEKVGLSVQGVYALRRRIALRTGKAPGRPSGVHVGVGEVILYDDDDIAEFVAWRAANPPTSNLSKLLVTAASTETLGTAIAGVGESADSNPTQVA